MNNKNRNPGWLFLGLLVAGFGLTGCGDDGADLPSQTVVDRENGYARFDPAGGVIPFPNNLLFTGSEDGTLNIPVADPEDYSDPQVAMNALDGFSTLTSFSTQMSVPVDPNSIVAGDSVRVFQVNLDPATGAVTGVSRELRAGVEYIAGVSPFDDSTVVLTPLAPLAGSSGYLVSLNSGLKSTAGVPLGAELYYALAKSGSALVDAEGNSQYSGLGDAQALALEPLRQLTFAAESAVEAYTIHNDTDNGISDQPASEIILSWSFRTQSIGASLDAIATSTTTAADTIQTTATGMDTKAVNPDLPGAADIHSGTLEVPYYSGIPTTEDPTAALTGFWRTAEGGFVTGYTPMPEAAGTETIPVLMTLPNATSRKTMPTAGWPVVIFQHGITQNRTHLLAVADTLATAGFAGIAIDLPLHGITDTSSPFYADGTFARERTFGLDLINNVSRLPGPDQAIDPSGTHFINLASLLTTRDNVRQAVADLMSLTANLSSVPQLDARNVYFVGHSLGAMVGTPYLAHSPDVKAAVLGFPGGGVAKLLDGSATFGPQIAEGLAAKGVVRGTPEYESFMLAAQTIVDTADPLNYTSGAVTGRGVLMFEVIGGNSSLPDQVVPNNVLADAPDGVIPSPTAGTDPLARAMGLSQFGATPPSNGTTALDAWVRFTAGHHGSLVTPNTAAGNSDPLSLAAFSEMHGQMASFLASDGTVLNISDQDVVEQPAAP